ncbi:Retrovirus-related Pol polyprotein from transposon [Trichinella sp. T9]|nr:Retrovirus-related Pol polyprotein from transposon [Trichinella sp. T9]
MDEQKAVLSAQQSTESAQMMGTARFPIGAHRPFNPEEGTWDTWILQFRSYLEINLINDSNLMRSCLLASLTLNVFEELRRSCLPTTPYDFTYDECVAKMKELYGRRVILMRERASFFRITQSDHQTPKQFANCLREAAGHCNFESFNTEAALVLQFINGMKNEEIKLRLLAKENIKLDEALSFLEMYEEIHCCSSRVTMQECHAVEETKGLKSGGVSNCFKCGKQGHLAKVCKHPQKLGKSQKQRPLNSWKDHKLYADGIYAVTERAHNFEVTVKINGSQFEWSWTLELQLPSFTGHQVNLKGETMVTVEGDTGTRKLVLRVAKNGATNVMEVFEDGLGHCTKVKAHVKLKDGVVPVFRKPFPLAFAMHDAVGKELERYVDMGVLTPIDRSAWAAPIVTGKKPNGMIRICADFSTGLNDRLMVDSYPILRPEDLYQTLRGGKTFTKLDLSEAYLQVELDEESKKILVINTHKGLYHYNRLPFGVASAPVIFQRVMDTMLAGIPNVAAYLDDIILTGATDGEHRRTLKLVLGRLKEFGLRIRKEKCTFFQREVEYLGHILSSKGIRADPKKTAAIVNMPLPTNIAKLRSFLGMCNYYTEFIPKLAEMCSPLNQLLRKDARWKWTAEHTKAVKRVKRLLNSPLLLTHYHPEWPIVLAADASNEGIGAVVYHRLRDGTVKVIAHASKTLNAAQSNYGQIEKEALALVYGVKKFHKYLWGRRFTLLTDHKPLVSIFGSKKGVPQMAACRLTRWAIALMNYSFDIEYRSTKNFCQADCLSRLPSSSDELFDANFDHREAEDELTLPVTARVIAEATEKDSVLKQVKQFVLSGWPEKCPREELRSYFIKRTELSVFYGCLIWGIWTVILMKLRSRVLMKLHETHPGRERMVSMARQFCWWPAMNKDIEMKAQSCEGCATAQKNPAKRLSLPRLELMGALVAARLVHYTQRALSLPIHSITCWCDSEVALSWVRSAASRWKPFVRNRVEEIQQLVEPASWRHCSGKDNPADWLSRGVTVTKLAEGNVWWHGPTWLARPQQAWPRRQENHERNPLIPPGEERTSKHATCALMTVQTTEEPLHPGRYGDIEKLFRISAYCRRFAKNCRSSVSERHGGNLTAWELHEAEEMWVRRTQEEEFQAEIQALVRHGRVAEHSRIRQLDPYLYERGVLRAGGRLVNSYLPASMQHPAVLPGNHELTRGLIRRCHQRQPHAGGRSQVKRVTRECLVCRRATARPTQPRMATLPRDRVVEAPAFSQVGMDFAGPLYV